MNLTVNCHASALEYMAECTLATVVDIAMSSRPKMGELRRQIQIAQNGIAWLAEYGRSNRDTCQRVNDVFNNYQGNVKKWAQDKLNDWHPKKPIKI